MAPLQGLVYEDRPRKSAIGFSKVVRIDGSLQREVSPNDFIKFGGAIPISSIFILLKSLHYVNRAKQNQNII